MGSAFIQQTKANEDLSKYHVLSLACNDKCDEKVVQSLE
jgi:hypothetical protein